MPDLAQTLACSPILSRIDYRNALLHGTPAATIHKLQRVQNNAARKNCNNLETVRDRM